MWPGRRVLWVDEFGDPSGMSGSLQLPDGGDGRRCSRDDDQVWLPQVDRAINPANAYASLALDWIEVVKVRQVGQGYRCELKDCRRARAEHVCARLVQATRVFPPDVRRHRLGRCRLQEARTHRPSWQSPRGQFAILEVYLGWTACPFDDHEITSCPEPCKAVLNDPDQPGSSRAVLAEPDPMCPN